MGVLDRFTAIKDSIVEIFGKGKDVVSKIAELPSAAIRQITSSTKTAALAVIAAIGTPIAISGEVIGETAKLGTTIASAAVNAPLHVIGAAKDIVTMPLKPITDKLPDLPSPTAMVNSVRDGINGGVDKLTGGLSGILQKGGGGGDSSPPAPPAG